MTNAVVREIGPLERRAARAISNVVLYDLVQDMAAKVDAIDPRFDEVNQKLDAILEKMNGGS